MRDTQQLIYGKQSRLVMLCLPNFARSLADKMRWEPRLCSAHASQKLAQRSSGRQRHEHDLHEPLVRWLLPSGFTRPSLPVNRRSGPVRLKLSADLSAKIYNIFLL